MNWDEVFSYELLNKNAVDARAPGAPIGPRAVQEERYEDVDDYDPVLRSHCRLVS